MALASWGCGDAARLPIGSSCTAATQCASGLCGSSVCLDPAADDDGDGLVNSVEVTLGTSALMADTDGDGADDLAEVVTLSAPADEDGDGFIDAVESRTEDADGDCLADQVDDQDVIANLPSERRPDACGNGAYLGIGVCALLERAFEGTCAAPLGQGFGCFDPEGVCQLTIDDGVGTLTWQNGAVHRDGLYASDGAACVTFGAGGLHVEKLVYARIDGGGVRCADGTEVAVEASLSQAIAYCIQGADGCSSAPLPESR
ncbi:MAG: hypothetical protein CVU56_10980 [Deltaproteobacteria bacterium HGW-Deltaproteobacteria-14]|nr:MAG: hypothetical protein CVU56_10980 [Deltaproteobacteria bacterium HGW-Deltaproteobacteria-14]